MFNMSKAKGAKRSNRENRKHRARCSILNRPMNFDTLKWINDQHPSSNAFMVAIHKRSDDLLKILNSRDIMTPGYVELFCSTLGRIGRGVPSDVKREMHGKFVPLMTEKNPFYNTIARFLLQQQQNHASILMALENLAAFITSDGVISEHPFITALRLHKLQRH